MLGKILNIFKSKPKVVVILGPTSTGKTSLSIKIAKEFNGEIISADSRQVYSELNLVSGKVKVEEMNKIPHHMINIVSVGDQYSADTYRIEASKKIQEILSKRKLPIICGGTGFYIDSLIFKNSFPEVKPQTEMRNELDKKSLDELFDILKEIDPERAKGIDLKNKVRLVRAIEVARLIGKNPPPQTYRDMNYKTLFIGLDMSDDVLKDRIKARIIDRIKSGMVDEVKKILESGIKKEVLYLLGLDAKFSAMIALNEISKSDAIEKLFLETWQYVKRQRTFWKRNKNIKWFDPKKVTEITNSIKIFLSL